VIYHTSFDEGGDLPLTGFTPPPVLKKLDLPAGKYLVTAKVLVNQNSGTGFFAAAACSLGTGPDIFLFGADLLDTGTFIAYAPADHVGLSGNILLTAVLQLTDPGTVEVRCSRSDAEMSASFVRLTAIRVSEVVIQ
jgi:hypothetical protein